MLQRVYVTLDEKQVGAGLDRKETRTRNVDTVTILEVLNCSTGSGLKLCSQFNSDIQLSLIEFIPGQQPDHHR